MRTERWRGTDSFGALVVAVLVGCGMLDPKTENINITDQEIFDVAAEQIPGLRARLLLLEIRRPADVPNSFVVLNRALASPEHKSGNSASTEPLAGAELFAFAGHAKRILEASFDPSGSRIVTASEDQTAIIWNARTGEQENILKGHLNRVNTARFNPKGLSAPEGLRVLTASQDGTAKVWDAETGGSLDTLSGHDGPVTKAVFSSDEKWIVTISPDSVALVWGRATGERRPEPKRLKHRESVTGVLFDVERNRILTTSQDQNLRWWSYIRQIRLLLKRSPHNQIKAMALDSASRTVLTASGRKVYLWNADPPRKLTSRSPKSTLLGHRGLIRDAKFSPDGKFVVTASEDQTARVWTLATREFRTLKGHQKAVTSATFSPDGRWIVTSSEDGTLRVWSAETSREVAVFGGSTGSMKSAKFNPEGNKILSTGEDNVARLWPWERPESITTYLQSRIRAKTTSCLSEKERLHFLKETASLANAALQACEACVPRFFEFLNGELPASMGFYLEAWARYQRCLQEVREPGLPPAGPRAGGNPGAG